MTRARFAAVFVTAFVLYGCSRAPSVQDQADLVSLAAKVELARGRILTQTEADEAQAAIVRLGASLVDVRRVRAINEAWDIAKPVVTAGISILISGVTQGGGQ